MGDWLASIFTGQNKTLNSDINQMGDLAGYSTKVGEGDTTAASKFYQDILGGDPSKISQSLAPEISSGQTQGQQAKQGMAQFGSRSGGTAAASAGIDAGTRANLINLIGALQSSSAQGAASLGTSNLNLASRDTSGQADMSNDRLHNWMDSMWGKALYAAQAAAQAAESGGGGGGGAAA